MLKTPGIGIITRTSIFQNPFSSNPFKIYLYGQQGRGANGAMARKRFLATRPSRNQLRKYNSHSALNSDSALDGNNGISQVSNNSPMFEEESERSEGFRNHLLLNTSLNPPPNNTFHNTSIFDTSPFNTLSSDNFLIFPWTSNRVFTLPKLHLLLRDTPTSSFKMVRIKNVPATISKEDSSSPSSKSSGSPNSELNPLGTSEFAKLEAQWEARARRHDRLLQRPKRGQSYVGVNGAKMQFDDRFMVVSKSPKKNKKRHPKVAAAKDNGTLTTPLENYYEAFEQGNHEGKSVWQHIPLAGFGRNPEPRVSRPSPEPDSNDIVHLTLTIQHN